MRQDPKNPETNCVPKSIKESDLIKGIELSGYPLQGLVADKMKSEFGVIEEWGYIDRETNAHRSLDIHAYKNLSKSSASKIEPSIIVMAECKKSIHPYIFFQNRIDRTVPGYPIVAGLPFGRIRIFQTMEDKSITESQLKGARGLELDNLEFVKNGPPKCSAFARAQLSGNKAELSGTEPFNKVVLPLVNAIEHARYMHQDHAMGILYPKLLISVCVLDASMIVVESPSQVSDPVLTPWVRVIRQESSKDTDSKPPTYYGIDMVHIDFLDEFLNTHLIPFAEEFGNRSIKMHEILLKGGEVDDLDNWTWDKIRPRAR